MVEIRGSECLVSNKDPEESEDRILRLSEGPNRLRRMYEGGTKDVCTKDVFPLYSKVGPNIFLWIWWQLEPRSLA